ncbi:MAG: hypothetical protein AVDCRST_MAG56-4027 [uncultured Cytophagales bacterium]|uniref:Uncharacterized protein n=1 Tax=uncultured Cytophagales bacterium TaxID=158755 RepID=A0A6J4JQ82_9SPHI|nr:MAG: hypothetical protein AVDCRST_MAG56-4027 [uncultured Cytophagales bacterium]
MFPVSRLTRCILCLVLLSLVPARAQSPEVGKEKRLIFHDIRTDARGHLLPWYDPEPGKSYDHVLRLVWGYWHNVPGYWIRDPRYKRVYPKWYMIFRTLDDPGIGGDQVAMMLSSLNLYYDYSGDPAVLADMKAQADLYLANGLSDPGSRWPHLPFPCNTEKVPVYDGDLILGKGYTQPDKAGSLGAELVMLYQKTGDEKYLTAALNIAATLARHVQPGDHDHSPLPFKVHVGTGEVGYLKNEKGEVEARSVYTSNWTGTLRLFRELTALGKGDKVVFEKAYQTLSAWLQTYPLKNNRWGPFFEDISMWSDTQINAGTLAWYLLEHPGWVPGGPARVRGIQDWTLSTLGIGHWQPYGLRVIGEQSVYKMQGQSHTARYAAVELRYAELTGDSSRKAEAVRQLNWATYMVDHDGKNRWPNWDTYEIWWTDGYGDYIRHYLRAMAAAPELAPSGQNHLLRSTSVVQQIAYEPARVRYTTFHGAAAEVFRLATKPQSVRVDDKPLAERPAGEGWSWKALDRGGVLTVRRTGGKAVVVGL